MRSYGFGSKNGFPWEGSHNKATLLVVQPTMSTLSAEDAYGKGSISFPAIPA